jgi:uncharacterized membrane protein
MGQKRSDYVKRTAAVCRTAAGKNISGGVFYMKKISEYLFLWAVGGCMYYGFEMVFRGFSHWTMFVLGGICFVFFAVQGKMLHWQDPLWMQIGRCMVFVTSMEFITGIIVNKWLHMNVWDYSRLPFQLFGQICVPFIIIFSGLAAAGIILSGYLMHWLYQEPKPHYHIL